MTRIEASGLPANAYAERVLIGGILAKRARFPEFRDVLSTGDFSLERNRTVWSAMLRLYDAGTPIDRVTIYTAMSEQERGAVDGLTGLAEYDAPEIMHLEAYARQVRDAAIRRRLVLASQQLAEVACEGQESADVVLGRAREIISGLEASAANDGEFRTPFEAIQDAGGIDQYLRVGATQGIPLPWPTIEGLVAGLQPGDLAILAADTGRGKTAAAINQALYAAERGYGVAIYSMEMSRRQVLNRVMALHGRFNSRAFRSSERTPIQDQDIMLAATYVSEQPIYIRDGSGCTVAGLIGGIQRLRAKHDVRLIIVDYLQLMSGDGRSRTEIVGGIARGLKNAAMELGIPILALSQLSRDHSKAKTVPELHDLRESGDIEQAANLVLFLHGETTYSVLPSELLPIDMIIAKQRDGTAQVKVPLLFRADCGYFVEVDR